MSLNIDVEYRERLRPPSTPALDRNYRQESKHQPRSHHHNHRNEAYSDPESDHELTERLNRLRGHEDEDQRSRSSRQRPKSGRVVRRDEREEPSDTESEEDDTDDRYQVEKAMRQYR